MPRTKADPTDPGTRRPKDSTFATEGTRFEPLRVPDRMPIVYCNSPSDTLAIFDLFIPRKMFQLMADNTNKNAHLGRPKNPHPKQHGGRDLGGARAREWINTTPEELYIFFAIHIFMGIKKEPNIKKYWNKGTKGTTHSAVINAMVLNRFEQITRYLLKGTRYAEVKV